MKYFYEYKEKDKNRYFSGHNLEKIEIKDNSNFIKLSGVDTINYVSGSQEEYWASVLDMREIEYLKIIPMLEGDDDLLDFGIKI